MRRDHKAAGAGSVAGAHGSTMATGKGQPGCDGDGRWGETHHLPRSSSMAQTQEILASFVCCSCGQRACPQLRIGAILPEKAPSAEACAEHARHYRERNHHA